MATLGRRATLRLLYENQDISADIAPHLVSATYTDHAQGRADELSVTLQDREGLWRRGWKPSKGARLTAAIVCRDWFKDGDEQILECGSFSLDDLELAGPPDVVVIKGVSIPVQSAMQRELRTRAWEKGTLKRVAQDIAERAGLGLFYDAPEHPFERAGQREESDLRFLQRMCADYGLHLKVTLKEIAVYKAKEYDAKPPPLTVSRSGGRVERHRFKEGVHAVYKAAQVSYWDAAKGELVEYTFTAPGETGSGQVLKINEQAESLAQAEELARARLRQANRGEIEIALSLVGEPRAWAGMTVQVEGWDSYDDVYALDEAVHSLSRSGYTTELKLKKTLGY